MQKIKNKNIETLGLNESVSLQPNVAEHKVTVRPKYKYNEGEVLDDLRDYIDKTYGEHYTTGSGYDFLDIAKDMGIGRDFCHGNAIKYLMRYGKKDGYNRKDLMKAIHYIIVLMSYNGEEK
tara:strand:+ start:163 stop:525 length:363 start_codon:yes stop_codon:yes gene_type:complete